MRTCSGQALSFPSRKLTVRTRTFVSNIFIVVKYLDFIKKQLRKLNSEAVFFFLHYYFHYRLSPIYLYLKGMFLTFNGNIFICFHCRFCFFLRYEQGQHTMFKVSFDVFLFHIFSHIKTTFTGA